MNKEKTDRRKLAELSLIFGVPIFTGANDNSRLTGLQKRLQKVVLPDLAPMEAYMDPENPEVHLVNHRLETWLKRIGWWHRPQHVTDLISFCMDVIDHSPFTYNPRIMETLDAIAQHLDSGGEFYAPTPPRRHNLLMSWKAVYA